MIRGLAQKFLEQPELAQFHFQRHFLAPFLDIFMDQGSLQAKDYVLEHISILLRDSGTKLQSGWSTILDLLSVASEDPRVFDRGFEIVKTIVSEFLDVKAISPARLMSIVSSFVSNGTEAAVALFVQIASKLPQTDVGSWLILLGALARAGQSPEMRVRREAHAAFLKIVTQGEALSDDILGSVLKEWIPLFFDGDSEDFWTSAAGFERKLWLVMLKPSWSRMSRFFGVILELFSVNARAKSAAFAKVSIEVMLEFLRFVYEGLGESEKEAACGQLLRMADGIGEIPMQNGRAFLTGVDLLHQQCPTEKTFITVLTRSNSICAENRMNVLWALNRSMLLAALLRGSEELRDDIADCMRETFAVFLTSEFMSEIKSEDAIAWNECIVASLRILNKMATDLFLACFERCCEQIIMMIKALNADVRDQITETMKRKLMD
jgi:hypothetical protein